MSIRLLDPTLGPVTATKARAIRPSTLDGAVLGLVNNGKTFGKEILERVTENLRAKYNISDVIMVKKATYSFPAAPEDVARLTAGATVIIAAIGD
jgi:hypothetical protein